MKTLLGILEDKTNNSYEFESILAGIKENFDPVKPEFDETSADDNLFRKIVC